MDREKDEDLTYLTFCNRARIQLTKKGLVSGLEPEHGIHAPVF